MSWWDTSNFTNLATNALKNAQKKIDKVLDIKDEEGGSDATPVSATTKPTASSPKPKSAEGDFWNSWFDGSEKEGSGEESPSTGRKSVRKSSSPTKSSSVKKNDDKKKGAGKQWNWWQAYVQEESSSSSIPLSKDDKPLPVGESCDAAAQMKDEEDRLQSTQIKATVSDFATDNTLNVTTDELKHSEITDVTLPDQVQDQLSHLDQTILTSDAPSVLLGVADDCCEVTDTDNRIDEPNMSTDIESTYDALNLSAGSEEKTNNSDNIEVQNEVFFKSDRHTDKGLSPDTLNTDTNSAGDTDTACDMPCDKSSEILLSNEVEVDQVLKVDSVLNEKALDDTIKSNQPHGPQCDGSKSFEMNETLPVIDSDISESSSFIQCSDQSFVQSVKGEASDSQTSVDVSDKTDASQLEDEFHGLFTDSHLQTEKPNTQQDPESVCSGAVHDQITVNQSALLNDTAGDCLRVTSEESTPQEDQNEVSDAQFIADEDEQRGLMDQSTASTGSSSSYVKCNLDDAMTESEVKHEANETDNMVKVESSHNSGHTSGDEIDTTTSSDIEIISTPTPNGDGNQMRPFDLSPLRHALSRSVRSSKGQGRNRSDSHDSQSSSSTGQSKSPERSSPENDHLDGSRNQGRGRSDQEGHPQLRETALQTDEAADENNPLATQKLLKSVLGDTPNNDELAKKLAEMKEILEAREGRLLQLSKENMDLQETCNILKVQLQQLEETREAEMADVTAVTDEFTQRLSEMEKKLQSTFKERDQIKKQLHSAQEELNKKANDRQAEKLMLEKDEQIAELLAEGEKLSKDQLKNNTIIKKLRAKAKDNETVIDSQKLKLEEQKTEIERLHVVLDSKEEMEKKQTDAINQLNKAVQKQEKEIIRLKTDYEDSHEKLRSMQGALDSSYKELAELHKENAARDSKAQEAALSAEMQAKDQLRISMDKLQQQTKMEQEGMILQIDDLRLSLSRAEKEYGRREDMLRQEISDLQLRLQEAETRNDELTQSVSAATRPLLRQIENLQSTYAAQSASYERVEKNLTERLAEVQDQLAIATEKERSSSEKAMESGSKLKSLESQIATLRQEKSHLVAQLEMEKTKAEMFEDAKNNESAQLEAVKQTHDRELSDLRKEKLLLENQLEMEKMKVEAERKKLIIAHDQLREMERRPTPKASPRESPHTVPAVSRDQSMILSREHSISSDMSTSGFTPLMQEDMLERTLMMASSNGNKTSLYESLRQTGATNLLENLQSQLKQREGEIVQLQSEIVELERTREAMARELVNLTTKNDELEEQVVELPQLKENYATLDGRYNALLQMYGEKVEETEELRLDLQDIKDMYKHQIDHLLKSHS